jgi:predicted RNA-binding Zn ribbon-like protein
MTGYDHEVVGGHAALDFVNSVHDWTEAEPRDYLTGFDQALGLGETVGLLTRSESRPLAGRAGDRELREMQALRELRARLARIFRGVVGSRAPAATDLDALARDAARAASAATLGAERGRVVRRIDASRAGVTTLRLRIVESAVALLTSPDLERVKACPGCGWFFLDDTKNGSRRWCSMRACGSLAKARRYYRRKRSANGRRRRPFEAP